MTTETNETGTIKLEDGKDHRFSTGTIEGNVTSVHFNREEGSISVFVVDSEGDEWLEKYSHRVSVQSEQSSE